MKIVQKGLTFGSEYRIINHTPPLLKYGLEAASGRLPLFKETLVKVWVYIDGFNLYNGAVRNTPYKWLDFLKIFFPPIK
jgi:hypothetical protein